MTRQSNSNKSSNELTVSRDNPPALLRDNEPADGADKSLTIAATLDYKGKPILISSGDLAEIQEKGIIFNLADPIELGTLSEFMQWLHDEFHSPFNADDVKKLGNMIPTTPDFLESLHDAYLRFVEGKITITELQVKTKEETYAFGATMSLLKDGEGLELFGGFRLNSIGIRVAVQGEKEEKEEKEENKNLV